MSYSTHLFDKTLLQIKHNFYESKILYKRFNKDHNINAPFIPIFLPTFFLNVYDHHQRFHAFIHMITIPSIFSVSFMSLLKRTMIHYLLELMFLFMYTSLQSMYILRKDKCWNTFSISKIKHLMKIAHLWCQLSLILHFINPEEIDVRHKSNVGRLILNYETLSKIKRPHSCVRHFR